MGDDPTGAGPVEFIELNADAQEALTLQSLCMKCMQTVRPYQSFLYPNVVLNVQK